MLLRFHAPEYEMDARLGIVRWRIASGVLVSRAATAATAILEIEVERLPSRDAGPARVHVEVEVANFYPALATAIARWVYAATQSRIHVIVTHGFLRSLAKLELEESAVGRFATRTRSRSTSATLRGRWSGRSPVCWRPRSPCSCGAADRPTIVGGPAAVRGARGGLARG